MSTLLQILGVTAAAFALGITGAVLVDVVNDAVAALRRDR